MIIYRFIMKYYVVKNCDNPGCRADKKKTLSAFVSFKIFLGHSLQWPGIIAAFTYRYIFYCLAEITCYRLLLVFFSI